MSKNITATLTLRFDEDSDDGFDKNGNKTDKQQDRDNKQNDDTSKYYIVLEQIDEALKEDDSEVESGEPFILIHAYPKDVKLTASSGGLEVMETRIKQHSEVIHFNASDGVRLQYPNARNVSIVRLGEFLKVINDVDGNVIDLESFNPSFCFSSSLNSVLCSDEVYGACEVYYQTEYSVVRYYPNPILLADFNSQKNETDTYFGGIIFGKLEVYLGLLSKKRIFASTLEVKIEPPPKPVEFARVYSYVVIDADGPHEAPEGWKTDKNTVIDGSMFNSELRKSNPKLDLKEELDPDNSYTYERTHLLITINANSQLFYEYYSHNYQDPFKSELIQYMNGLRAFVFGGWSVQFYVRFSEPPGGRLPKSAESFYFDMYNLTWRDIFMNVNKENVFQSLKENHYTNLLKEGEEE